MVGASRLTTAGSIGAAAQAASTRFGGSASSERQVPCRERSPKAGEIGLAAAFGEADQQRCVVPERLARGDAEPVGVVGPLGHPRHLDERATGRRRRAWAAVARPAPAGPASTSGAGAPPARRVSAQPPRYSRCAAPITSRRAAGRHRDVVALPVATAPASSGATRRDRISGATRSARTDSGPSPSSSSSP